MQVLHVFDTEIVDITGNKISDQIINDFESKLTKSKKKDIIGIEKFANGE
jgi:hypothetical protein